MGESLEEAPWVCPNGHLFDIKGKEIKTWNPSER